MMPSSTPRLRRLTGAIVVAALAATLPTVTHAQQVANADYQIAEAVQAAPPASRAGATVHGWTPDGTSVTLRRGTNDLVCLSDNPAADGWSVACYPTSIEPYMHRGRELSAAGTTDSQERLRIRWAEADAGTLAMPEDPATVYILAGEGFNADTGEVINPFLRWAIYTPWATPESTGLPPQPLAPGAPWIMFPGTPGAHIMVTPPRPGGND